MADTGLNEFSFLWCFPSVREEDTCGYIAARPLPGVFARLSDQAEALPRGCT